MSSNGASAPVTRKGAESGTNEVLGNNCRKSQQSRLELGLRLSRGFSRANDLRCRRTSRRTESFSSPDERRNLNELAFESDRREWDKRNLLPFQFHSRSLIEKR
jgi:hypothetical protein